jgi:hypothetical protein
MWNLWRMAANPTVRPFLHIQTQEQSVEFCRAMAGSSTLYNLSFRL